MEPRVVEAYVRSGQVRFEYRDLPILGAASVRAAEAAACAADQGGFWRYHDTLFRNQGTTGGSAYSDERLRAMATGIGLDAASFDACLAAETHTADIVAGAREAQVQGIASTPTLVVDGRVVEGFQWEDVRTAIDAALAG